MQVNVYAASPAPSSEGVSDLASSVAPGGLHPYEQRGACTLRVGARVSKGGVVVPAQLMRMVASHLIGYGCPARQYELELF